jgi:hypothetical protein
MKAMEALRKERIEKNNGLLLYLTECKQGHQCISSNIGVALMI